MAKIKLTKGELKKQRDALRQYQRYLPTLQLKKQQLQMEILHQDAALAARRSASERQAHAMEVWLGLLGDLMLKIDLKKWVAPIEVATGSKNIAGVDLPVFENAKFGDEEYDLFVVPAWVDTAIVELQKLVSLREEIAIIERGVTVLRQELRITTQRVNLFEKVKIPEAEEIIRRIKIYIGDQMANAVGRSKIAKRKIEEVFAREALAV